MKENNKCFEKIHQRTKASLERESRERFPKDLPFQLKYEEYLALSQAKSIGRKRTVVLLSISRESKYKDSG